MEQGNGFRRTLLSRFLTLVSRPSTTMDELLRLILDKALEITSSDAGGGIFVFETLEKKQTVLASVMRGELPEASSNLLEFWRQNHHHPELIVLPPRQSYCIDVHEQDSDHFRTLAGSRSSLWVPLLDGKIAIGAIHVASSQPGNYYESYLQQLQNLAADAVPAIHRLLLREQIARAGGPIDIVGTSPPFLELERQIRFAAAQSKSPVLIAGERGSGKELTAWAVHSWSDRRDLPFLPVLTSAFVENLFADELFGHEQNAYTGATRKRLGKFQSAEGGTVFLDEVGDMTPAVQSALLRIIERGELQRIGRDRPLPIDVRVIAATNRSLHELIAQGKFREDLYDRLSVFEIRVPPLRERQEDIPLLTSHFLSNYCQQMRRNFMVADMCATCRNSELAGCATAEFYQALLNYEWPGNVRELEKLIRRLVAIAPDEILDVNHLPEQFKRPGVKVSTHEIEGLTLNAVVRNHIERVLQMHNHNQSQAAKVLGLPLSTLRSKMKKLGIGIRS